MMGEPSRRPSPLAHTPPPGKFIAIEGPDGAGKSTLAKSLHAALHAAFIGTRPPPILTREPGGSPNAEAVRELVLSSLHAWGQRTELLLMLAARAEHHDATIAPALVRGSWVVCDRYVDSTVAYQGHGRVVASEAVIRAMSTWAAPCNPDLVLVVDAPADVCESRLVTSGKRRDRFDTETAEFMTRVRDGFRSIALRSPQRYILLDGRTSPESVLSYALQAIRERFGITVG